MNEGRTIKVIRNTAYSFVYQLSDIVFSFILRTIFIRTLGKSYLGISGLFANILTVLSLMDLGVGSAIVFALYKPLAEHDDNKVATLMQLYKKVYICIGVLVCGIGFSLTPFLNKIIHLPETINHIYLIYWLSIANTAMSYFLAYRRSLLIADQRSDINVKNQLLFRITRFILLAFALLGTHNYIVYLALDVANTLCSNLQITYLVKKRYAYIETAETVPLSGSEKKQILRYMYSGIFSKFGQTIVNSTDSIIISTFVSTVLVGIYSNYSMITTSLEMAVYIFFSGITASIGNFAVEKDAKQSEELFRNVTFINYMVSFVCVVCLFSLLSPFVLIWTGSNDYLLSNITVAVIVLNFYIASMQKSIECFVGAVGEMGYHNRFRGIIEGVVNLVVSLGLVQYTNLGITGVFLGTTVCFVVGRIWMDAYVLYKYWFKSKVRNYVVRYIVRLVLTMGVAFVVRYLTSVFFEKFGISLLTWSACAIGLFVVVCVTILGLYRNRKEFAFFKQLIKKIIIVKK